MYSNAQKNNNGRFCLFHFKINAFILLIISCATAFAGEQQRFDVSKAWFKPELLVNNQPEICEPIFERYVDYFVSTGASNPLKPISARYWEKHNPGALTNKIHEIEWVGIGEGEEENRLAQWRQDGKYLGIIEQSQAIGWRPPTYQYYLIDKPPLSADVKNGAKVHYGEGPISYLSETDKPGIFDVIYESDPRFKNFKQNTFVQVANVYLFNDQMYLALTSNSSYKQGPAVYFIASITTPHQVKTVCKFTALPSSDAIRSESGKISNFKEFEDVVLKIMGGGGNCGTLNAPARAMHELREGLNSLIFRPWTYSSSMGNYDFSSWGYSGAWNYRKYLEFNALLPKARLGLADKYVKDYQLDKNQALILANEGIRSILARAFNHGRAEDKHQELHQVLLEGKMVEEISSLLPEPEAMNDVYGDSLLAFAIGHPRLVELLLKRGFDPNKTNAFGKTPLMYAAQFNDLESAKLLIKYGANPALATTRPGDSCNYTIMTNHVTALHYAVRYASRDFIMWIVEAGAVTSAQDSNGHTPFEYLTKFGGYVGYRKTADTSYGEQNAFLTKSHFDSLAALLTPFSENKRQLVSDEENRNAELLYQSGKVREAYVAVKKSLSLNPMNERALSNLSLIALKLGYYGESAKSATYVIKHATSDNERASAYFNIGLACHAKAKKGFHYATIFYDGETFCQERWDRYHGPLYYYLKAYQTFPTKSRANAIAEFFDEIDNQHGKWLCKKRDADSNSRAVYVARNHVYFLTKTGTEIVYQRFARRERDKDIALEVTKKEEFPLGNGLSVSRWEVDVPFQGTLVLDEQLCSRYLPSMIDDKTELVELYSHGENRPVTVTTNTSKPIVLVLYGNNASWTITDDSKNIHAIYVHGKDATLRHPNKTQAVVYMDTKQYVYSEPWGSSFNAYTETMVGLKIGALIDSTSRPHTKLDDVVLSSLPHCDNSRVRTNCRTH